MLNYLHIVPAVIATFLLLCATNTQAATNDEQWTDEEIYAANTAADCPYLTQDGKDMILYNNLARLYPKKFAAIELYDRRESAYLTSLIKTLNNMEPVHALTVNATATDFAQCWATVSGKKGLIGHDRVGCQSFQLGEISGENCSYGHIDGRDALLGLLVDYGVPSLGHRYNCLYNKFNSVGIGIAEHHSEYHLCFVMDFTSEDGEDYRSPDCTMHPTQHEVAPDTVPGQDPEPIPTSSTSNGHNPPADTIYVYVRPSDLPPAGDSRANQPSVTITQGDKRRMAGGNHLLDQYYEQSGKRSVGFISAGYAYSLADCCHMLSLSFFDFRFGMFGISPLCAEMSVSPWNARVAYRPTLKFFIPVSSTLAVTPYAGVAVDASRVVKYIYPGYDYNPQRDFYLSAIAGVSLYVTAAKHVPFELKAEYRHPVNALSSGNYHPRGLYFGAQIYFARIW